jgi:hypothetical protein
VEVEFPPMLWPLLIATAVLLGSLLVYGLALHLIVRVVVRLIRSDRNDPGFWKSTGVMAVATLIMAAAHLTLIALWAVTFLLCGQAADWGTAFYLSAQTFPALGYGDVRFSERWRLLGPLEAINGILFCGLSTAVLFAIMSQLIASRLRAETGYRSEAAGEATPLPEAGGAPSR